MSPEYIVHIDFPLLQDGGSNIGMVVGIIVAVLVVCLLAAFGMWFLLGVPSTPPDVEMQTKHLEVNDLSIRSKDVQHQNTHGGSQKPRMGDGHASA